MNQSPIGKFNRKPSQAPQNVPLNPYGIFHRDLCSHLLNLRAVLDGLRVAGSGNSRRDFEPLWRYGHFELLDGGKRTARVIPASAPRSARETALIIVHFRLIAGGGYPSVNHG